MTSGRRNIPRAQWEKFNDHRLAGLTIAAAANLAGISLITAQRAIEDGRVERPRPIPTHQLKPEPKKALSDFGLFRRRYFGRVAVPWQIEVAEQIAELLDTPDKEHLVVNCPPGVGKTTLFVHDLVAWLLCRNRNTRVLLGSRAQRQADSYVLRLKRTFERTEPVLADPKRKIRGLEHDAEGTLVFDYGRFRPLGAEQWRTSQFVVLQPDDAAIAEKECSVAGYGLDGPYLGQRFDLVIWDDLVDSKHLRTLESREKLQDRWEDEMETRLEPGGLLVLQGQRMGSDDLYRYALNKQVPADDEGTEMVPMFHHVVYKAHYDEKCTGEHTGTKPYPDGCLLDPQRLPWREIVSIKTNRASKFAVLYQQEDTDPLDVLVPKAWIDGGTDPATGETWPGCWDTDRDAWQIPQGLTQPRFAVITADPSPTRYWAIQLWLVHPPSEQRLLIDGYKGVMDAPDFLDWNHNQGRFYGLLDEWWSKARDHGIPIGHVIVEQNAAQRFLLQYEHVQRWQRLRGVNIIAHTTSANKTNPDYGVQTIAPHYRYGRIRLPGKGLGRVASLALINEVTRWPHGSSDDQVMAHWFLEWNMRQLLNTQMTTPPKQARPSWMRNRPSRFRGAA